ncbi:hypothetical protein [Oceanibaculum indicum]|uniref:Uncharacterized protein n=1 Tax=Oceanibaculum indicum TaxID=526216 RepID=A0A420WGU2_9PROT|nr:hypothetical protein [Oceanibaculum indicum]RKQ70155.1 hypothetical protein BCL74_2095 [Oceanibaculum indicum]
MNALSPVSATTATAAGVLLSFHARGYVREFCREELHRQQTILRRSAQKLTPAQRRDAERAIDMCAEVLDACDAADPAYCAPLIGAGSL